MIAIIKNAVLLKLSIPQNLLDCLIDYFKLRLLLYLWAVAKL